jgi:TDG/mug DNA glycosylase family protein
VPRPRDIVTEHPRILFVGINPGRTSGQIGHHFAGPGNPFWKLLHAAGLVPVVLRAEEDARLVEWGYALVNLCPRPTRTAAELTRAELARGRRRLLAKIRQMRPHVVALVGVTLYPAIFGGARVAAGARGPGPKPVTLEGAPVFVLPNPSGLNASYPSFAAKLAWFEQLRAFAG